LLQLYPILYLIFVLHYNQPDLYIDYYIRNSEENLVNMLGDLIVLGPDFVEMDFGFELVVVMEVVVKVHLDMDLEENFLVLLVDNS